MKSFIASAVLVAALAAPANADRFTATYTGTVRGGSDSHNVFNQAGADLTGQAFTAVFTLDDSAVDIYVQNDPVYYGVYNSGPVSPIAATMTIGGVSYSFLPGANAYDDYLRWTRYPGGVFDQLMGNVTRYIDDGSAATIAQIQIYGNTSLDDFLAGGLDYHVPFAKDFGSDTGGTVIIASYPDKGGSALYDEQLNLGVSRIVYAAAPQAVPEPASWAMMLAGFALAGTAMRSRRTKIRFA